LSWKNFLGSWGAAGALPLSNNRHPGGLLYVADLGALSSEREPSLTILMITLLISPEITIGLGITAVALTAAASLRGTCR